jgi:hypothetical protein
MTYLLLSGGAVAVEVIDRALRLRFGSAKCSGGGYLI